MSPLGKIPAYSDDDVGISDSSVILTYLDRIHPIPPCNRVTPLGTRGRFGWKSSLIPN